MTIFSHLNDKFNFGKHRNFALGDILTYDADYVRWVIENVNVTTCHFTESVIEEIKYTFPNFLNTETYHELIQRLEEYDDSFHHDSYKDENHCDDYNYYKHETFEYDDDNYETSKNELYYQNWKEDYDDSTNNPYYNENLDWDQQSIEFWDSI